MKGRDILKGLTEAHRPKNVVDDSEEPRRSGSVRALEAELDQIAEQAATAKALQETIAKEGQIVELDPALIDSATIADRIPTEIDPDFEELKAAIKTAGQQVPILARPHPTLSHRFQAAYGHRRLRAAIELGVQVKAIVHDLSDQQMVLAQGQENGPRLDLSFVERALYASRLLKHGYDRDIVCNALGVDKPEVSRLLQVADGIDTKVIMAIGPARKIGRPRWMALAKQLDSPKAQRQINELLTDSNFTSSMDSNARFALALAGTRSGRAMKEPTKKPLRGKNGQKIGWMQDTRKGVMLTIEHPAFSKYLQNRLLELMNEFEAETDGPVSQLE